MSREPSPDSPLFELPTKRSYAPDAIGQSAHLFDRISRAGAGRSLATDISIPTLVQVTAQVSGARLGSVDFDLLTLLCKSRVDEPDRAAKQAAREAKAAGATTEEIADAATAARAAALSSRWVGTTQHAISEAMYGYKGGEQYRLILGGFDNLLSAVLTLPGFDAQTGKWDGRALSKVHLLDSVVGIDTDQRFVEARAEGGVALARAFGGSRGTVTLRAELATWLATAVDRQFGRELDFSVQRALNGTAKSIWIQLEASVFTPVPGHEQDLEYLELMMDDQTFAALGANCARPRDNIVRIRRALDAILRQDPTYVGYEDVRDPADRRRVRSISIVRSHGQLRQTRLRARTRGQMQLQDVHTS